MANEISLTLGLRVIKDNLKFVLEPAKIPRDLTGSRRHSSTQTIGFAAHEALTTGDLATAGYALFVNLDATNYVEIGIDDSATFEPLAKLLPGDWAILPLTTLAIYAKANTGAVELDYTIFER